jgi:hypothetical protein
MSFLKMLAGFIIGAIAGAALALALCVAAAQIFSISQMEGAYAMGVAFFYMPLGALIGGIVGAVWMALRRKRPS